MTTKFQNHLFGHRFLTDIVDWMRHNLTPEDVFPREDLSGWARVNGYVHENANEESTQSDPWLGTSSVSSGRLHWTRTTISQEASNDPRHSS